MRELIQKNINLYFNTKIAKTAFLIVFIIISCFYGIGSYAISDINEGIYAEIAREMFASKQYIIPTLNTLPYLEKPPLLYWLISGAYHLLGITEFSSRIIPALSYALTCLCLYIFLRSCRKPSAGYWSALVFASSLCINIIGHVVFFDMLLTASITFTLLAFYQWYQLQQKFWLYVMYTTAAFAFMIKGLIALVICGSVCLTFMLLRQAPLKSYLKILNPLGIAIFLLIILPWHIAAANQLPDFGWHFFINEQIMRFFNQRIPHDYHTGPFYYYIPRIFIYMLPWSIFIIHVLSQFKDSFTQRHPLEIFLWSWLIVPLIIFSLSSAKGDYYMIVSMPALAMFIGCSVDKGIEQQKRRILAINFYSSIFLTLGGIFYILTTDHGLSHGRLALFAFPAILAYALLSILIVYYTKKSSYIAFLTAIFGLLLLLINTKIDSELQQCKSQINLVQYIKNYGPKRPVYLYQDYEKLSSISFYLGRPVTIIDSVSKDLYYGSSFPSIVQTFKTFNQFINSDYNKPLYLIIRKDYMPSFTRKINGKTYCIVNESDAAYLISNNLCDCNDL